MDDFGCCCCCGGPFFFVFAFILWDISESAMAKRTWTSRTSRLDARNKGKLLCSSNDNEVIEIRTWLISNDHHDSWVHHRWIWQSAAEYRTHTMNDYIVWHFLSLSLFHNFIMILPKSTDNGYALLFSQRQMSFVGQALSFANESWEESLRLNEKWLQGVSN